MAIDRRRMGRVHLAAKVAEGALMCVCLLAFFVFMASFMGLAGGLS